MNFVNLIAAARLGTTKQVTPLKISRYEDAIYKYLSSLRTLFPDLTLVPNHHLALHLGEVLENFGPSHAYWAFPFERLIRIIRQAKVNYRNGM